MEAGRLWQRSSSRLVKNGIQETQLDLHTVPVLTTHAWYWQLDAAGYTRRGLSAVHLNMTVVRIFGFPVEDGFQLQVQSPFLPL